MSEWVEENLGQLATIEIGGTPSRNVPVFWANEGTIGYPWVSIADLGSKYVTDTKELITAAGVRSSNVKLIESGTLIMSFKLTIGRAGIAGCDLFTNEAIAAIVPDRRRIDSGFLYYLLPPIAKGSVTDTAIKGSTLNKQKLARLRLRFPRDIDQQRRIAEILSTLDEAIEQTEALIAKMQQVKAGLMHDLFTRGVIPDGRLRPTREQAPELYKESPLGWIPKEWEVRSCAEICVSIIDCKNRTPPIMTDGHPVIRTPNVRDGEFVWNDLNYTDAESYVVWTARGKPQPGDIVITREAPVGEVCMIPEDLQDPCLGQRMMLYRPNPDLVNAGYMLHALQSPRLQKYLDLISGGSTVGHVKVGEIRSLLLPCPNLGEQIVIAEALNAVRSDLSSTVESRVKLCLQKQGLMHDLLKGLVTMPDLAREGSTGIGMAEKA